MAQSQLRVYYGPNDTCEAPASKANHETVSLPLGDVLPLLVDAVRSQRTWLGDFADDEITISTDLYQVLLAYQHYRRPVA
jgi:hypothetical protein